MRKIVLLLLSLTLLISCQQKQDKPAESAEENGTAIPIPDPEFKATIAPTIEGSKADFPFSLKVPNVLVILLDDVGFGQTSTFSEPHL